MATYLDVVNNVLKRLREPTVTSVTDTDYAQMVGVFVNDAKREVEAANSWNALMTTVLVTTAAGTRNYTLTGSGTKFKEEDVLNDTQNIAMRSVPQTWLNRQYYLSTVQNAAPCYYSYNGVDSNGDTKVDLWPCPDAVYNLRFELNIPQGDLSNDATQILVPWEPIALLAYSKAIAERGEDSGVTTSEAYLMYRLALADAIALEKTRYDDSLVWEAV